ncbi:MAG: GNAT family N-acetyltransferase [Proteobacteria bacterium]|nr:GNAT family N-acetyltransferase [Pseudomonadota bacterium]
MQGISQLKTQRLRLRQWQDSDLEPFADMNADEEVMKFFPFTYDREETRQAIQKYSEPITENCWGFWAAQRLEDCAFVGIIGLHRVDDLPMVDSVEVGWRLARTCWGLGYATEGACAWRAKLAASQSGHILVQRLPRYRQKFPALKGPRRVWAKRACTLQDCQAAISRPPQTVN